MVDFKKRLTGEKTEKPTDPVALYGTLDRAHDKGPLRPAQDAVLTAWFKKHQSDRDVIVKLHTGQGKTLIGLLMLQSRLNAGKGPAVYLCPNNFLIEQTCEQARQFGLKTCTAQAGDLPEEFANSSSILVTSVQKMFNGLTKFGLHGRSVGVGVVLMDDAHACADSIRNACRLRIEKDDGAYAAILALFATDLEGQGVGTYADIVNGKSDAVLPVPYWAWTAHEASLAKILSTNSDQKSIKFAWPLLKDRLSHCQCVVSGGSIEIEPYVAPLSAFGSYYKAEHRIFMSATVTDDAFLVKGLQLSPLTISNPLTYDKETWSGEKMVLLPSLIHEELDRGLIVNTLAKSNPKRSYGVVALTPSFARSADWKAVGATVTDSETVWSAVSGLRSGNYESTVVLVNRYDGIDLPDQACRVLIFDSRPHSECLVDMNQERCRANGEITLMRTIRSVEQGMGRSVRGEKDYCVIVVVGPDLVRLLREKASRKHLSPQMAKQIEIGLEIAELARQEIEGGKEPKEALNSLVRQSLTRDDGWKAYYAEQMNGVMPGRESGKVLRIYAAELEAEDLYMSGDYSAASNRIQKMLDERLVEPDDTGWYLQERARYLYLANRTESQALQIVAHKKNRLLLKPDSGVTVAKLTVVSQGRAERISKWIGKFDSYADLDVTVSEMLGRLVFGTRAESFEEALDDLSRALGFEGERPDAQWKEGPDNLWALDDTQYLLFECKSEVDIQRSHVNKREAEQMNRSAAWFEKHYVGMKAKYLIIHPGSKVESAAAFTHPVEVLRGDSLRKLIKACRDFFKSFESQNFRDLSVGHIQSLINSHGLSIEKILSGYSGKLKDLK